MESKIAPLPMEFEQESRHVLDYGLKNLCFLVSFRKNMAIAMSTLHGLQSETNRLFSLNDTVFEIAGSDVAKFHVFFKKLSSVVETMANDLLVSKHHGDHPTVLASLVLQIMWDGFQPASTECSFCVDDDKERPIFEELYKRGDTATEFMARVGVSRQLQGNCSRSHLVRLNELAADVSDQARVVLKEFDLYDDLPSTSRKHICFLPRGLAPYWQRESLVVLGQQLDCFGRTLLHHVLDGRVDPLFNINPREESLDSDSLDKPDILGRSPLHIACHKGTDSQVEALIELGADISRRTFHGSLPLHYAAASGAVAICQILLNTPGIDANAVDKYGNAALVYAVNRNAKGVIQLLLSFPGIDPTAINKYGNSTLIYAIEKGNLDMIKLLLSIPRIDVNAVDKQGRTALLYAVKNRKIEIFKLLLQHWKIVPESPTGLRQPLIEAAAQGNEIMVQLLLAAGANPDTEYNGRTALLHALYNNDIRVVSLLGTEKHELLLHSYELGQTPLAIAATTGFLQGMKYLMDQKDIDMNSRDDLGRTPLVWAAKYGHFPAVELLLQHSDVDLSIADNNGITAIHHALNEKHHTLANIIEQEIRRRTKDHELEIKAVKDTVPGTCLNCGFSVHSLHNFCTCISAAANIR